MIKTVNWHDLRPCNKQDIITCIVNDRHVCCWLITFDKQVKDMLHASLPVVLFIVDRLVDMRKFMFWRHWSMTKMADIMQTTFSTAFSWKNIFVSWEFQKSYLVEGMAWCQTSDKLSPEPHAVAAQWMMHVSPVCNKLTLCGLVMLYGDIELGQVMAWCLTAPSHYLNQCWLMISNCVLWHSLESNFTRSTHEFDLKPVFRLELHTCTCTTIPPRGEWIKSFHRKWIAEKYIFVYSPFPPMSVIWCRFLKFHLKKDKIPYNYQRVIYDLLLKKKTNGKMKHIVRHSETMVKVS